jgi:hypothetical protein
MGFSLIQAIGHARRAVPSSRHLGSGTQRYGKDDLVASTFYAVQSPVSNGDYYAGEGLKEFVRLVAERGLWNIIQTNGPHPGTSLGREAPSRVQAISIS